MCIFTDTPEELAERMSIIFEGQMRFAMMMAEFHITQEKMKMDADRRRRQAQMRRNRDELDRILAARKDQLTNPD